MSCCCCQGMDKLAHPGNEVLFKEKEMNDQVFKICERTLNVNCEEVEADLKRL